MSALVSVSCFILSDTELNILLYIKVIQNEVRATGVSSGVAHLITPERSSGMISVFLVLLCLWFICVLLTVLKMYFLYFLPSAGGVLLSETHTSSDTWLTAGGRRATGESRTDTDTHGNQPSVASLLQLCSCGLQLHQNTSAE